MRTLLIICFLISPAEVFGQKHFTGHMKKDEPVFPKSNPIALCSDKSFWYSENLKACEHHGGVRQWIGLQYLNADGREITSAQIVLDNLKKEITGGYKPVATSNRKASRKSFPFVKVKPEKEKP